MASPAAASAVSDGAAAAPLFARPLPPPHPREHALWAHFSRLASGGGPSSASLRHLSVRRSPLKGRWLGADRGYKKGELIFAEKPVLSVSDDPSVCLACGVRHGGGNGGAAAGATPKCAQFTALFGSMKLALSSVASVAEQTDYPVSRLRELLKFVAVTHRDTFAPERAAVKRTEEQRRAACDMWLLLGLDDGSSTVESVDAASGKTVYTTTPRAADAHRSAIAAQVHALLPLTFRKHYPPPLLEQVLNVLELNAHETSDSVDGSVGDSVFPFFAMIEHSCVENCCWTASNDTMRITALRDIPAPAQSAADPAAMDFDFHTALVRGVSSSFERALQMAPPPVPIDVSLAKQQHATYSALLHRLLPGGVTELPSPAQYPDSNFIEDTALVLRDVIVISRPGAPSRLGEEDGVAEAASGMPFRRQVRIKEPATLDGGDVLFTGRHLFVGESKRTNKEATAQLREFFQGDKQVHFSVHAVPVLAGLHLKSVVSILADGVLVLAEGDLAAEAVRARIESVAPGVYSFVLVPDMAASNVLRVGRTLLVQRGFPRSEAILRAAADKHGLQVETLEMSELIKADGALTCGSLLVPKLPLQQSQAPVAFVDADADAGLTPLSINYAPVFLPTSKRRAYLRSCYGFSCVCPLCRGEGEMMADLARGFRCTAPGGCAVAGGVVCPFGEGAPTDRWSCTRCGSAASAADIASFLAAEKLVLESVLALPPSIAAAFAAKDAPQLGEGEDVLDRIAGEPGLAEEMQARLEQIVLTVAAAAPASASASASNAAGASSSSSAPSPASSSSSSSLPVSLASLSVSPAPAKTARKAARQRKAASKRACGSGVGAGFFVLEPGQKEAVARMAPQHFVVHQAAELWLSSRLAQLLSLPAAQSASPAQWAPLLSCAQMRLASLKIVLRSETHWALARELDRLGALATLSGRMDLAREAWAAAHHVHRSCFGDEADSTRRALHRVQHPPRNRQELGIDEQETEEE